MCFIHYTTINTHLFVKAQGLLVEMAEVVDDAVVALNLHHLVVAVVAELVGVTGSLVQRGVQHAPQTHRQHLPRAFTGGTGRGAGGGGRRGVQ